MSPVLAEEPADDPRDDRRGVEAAPLDGLETPNDSPGPTRLDHQGIGDHVGERDRAGRDDEQEQQRRLAAGTDRDEVGQQQAEEGERRGRGSGRIASATRRGARSRSGARRAA